MILLIDNDDSFVHGARTSTLPSGADGVDGAEGAMRAAAASDAPVLSWGPQDDRFVPPPVELVL